MQPSYCGFLVFHIFPVIDYLLDVYKAYVMIKAGKAVKLTYLSWQNFYASEKPGVLSGVFIFISFFKKNPILHIINNAVL